MKTISLKGLILIAMGIILFQSTGQLQGQVSIAAPKWEGTFPNKPEFLHYATPDAAYVVGTNTTDAAVLDGVSGKVLWNHDFETLLGTKKCGLQYVMHQAGVLFIYRSKGKSDVLHVLDLKTGSELWNSEQFQNLSLSSIIYLPELESFVIVTKTHLHMIEARTGKEKWNNDKFTGSVAYSQYDDARKELILLNYKTSWGALTSGYKNQIMSLNVATGAVNWEQSYFGVIHLNEYSNRPVFEMIVKDENIYLMVMGLQVLNRNTGMEVWRTDFDLYDSKANFGAPGYTYFYRGIAYPLIADDAVYLVYNKQANAKVNVQKLNKSNGNIIWEYRVEGRNNPVPNIRLHEDKLLVQLGGRINIVGPQQVGSTYIFTSKYKWVGDYGVVALDAASGTVVWDYRKLSDRITNIEVKGDKVYFADAKTLYAANISDGKLVQSVGVKSIKCGEPFEVLLLENSILSVGEKGMGSTKLSDFTVDWTVPMSNTSEGSELDGNLYLLKGEKGINMVSLPSGKISATFKYTKGVKYAVTNEGKNLFIMGPKTAARFDI